MNGIIKRIIARKKSGTDCTEQESAEMKQFLKRIFKNARKGKLYTFDKVVLITGIEKEFPLEFGEAIDEFERRL